MATATGNKSYACPVASALSALDKTSDALLELESALGTVLRYDELVRPFRAAGHSAAPDAAEPEKHKRDASPNAADTALDGILDANRARLRAGFEMKSAMAEKNMTSIRTLTKLTGMSETTLRKVLNGDVTVGLRYYYKLAVELGCLARIQQILPDDGTT